MAEKSKANAKKSDNKKKKQTLSPRARQIISALLVLLLVVVVNHFMGDPLELYPQPEQAASATVAQADAGPQAGAQTASVVAGKTLDVYVLDVGQGDSIFLRSPSGKTMLVDASVSGMFSRIDDFLQAQGVERLDVVIGTHPHADHIGGMRKVVEKYEIGTYYMPNHASTTQTFEKLLDALDARGVEIREAAASGASGAGGATEDSFIPWDDAVEIRILSPLAEREYKDTNDYSVVCRVKYGDTAILLTGDAEKHAEEAMLAELPPSYFESVILKLGHHGSSTSSSSALLDATKPKVAIASLGEDNTYGHPHVELMERVEAYGLEFYRTDLDGTVLVRLDGTGYVIETEK